MTVTAERFKFLDQETHVPIIKASEVLDNSIYAQVKENLLKEKTNPSGPLNNSTLKGLGASLSGFLTNPDEGLRDLNTTVTRAIRDIENNVALPEPFREVLASFGGTTSQVIVAAVLQNTNTVRGFCNGSGRFSNRSALERLLGLNSSILTGIIKRVLMRLLRDTCRHLDMRAVGTVPNQRSSRQRERRVDDAGNWVSDTGINNAIPWSSSRHTADILDVEEVLYYTRLKQEYEAELQEDTQIDPSFVQNQISSFAISQGPVFENVSTIDDLETYIQDRGIGETEKESLLTYVDGVITDMGPLDPKFHSLNRVRAALRESSEYSRMENDIHLRYSHVDDNLAASYERLRTNTEVGSIDINVDDEDNPLDPRMVDVIQYVKSLKETLDQAPEYSWIREGGNVPSDGIKIDTAPAAVLAFLSEKEVTKNDAYKPNDLSLTTTHYLRFEGERV